MNWEDNNAFGGRRGQYGSYAEFSARAEAQAQAVLQNNHLFERVKPLLMKALNWKVQGRLPIRVIQPIQNIKVDMAKGGVQSDGSSRIGGEVIPPGIDLVYDGFELGQLFFKSYRGDKEGPEYSIFTGENVVIGNQQVNRNSGLIGLLVKTDIFTTIMNLVGQKESE